MTRTLIEKKLQPRRVTHDSISGPLSADELQKIDAYWRACNYLAAGMIYLRDNPAATKTSQARAH